MIYSKKVNELGIIGGIPKRVRRLLNQLGVTVHLGSRSEGVDALHWEFLLLDIPRDVTTSRLIELVTELRANEYQGTTEDGQHIFWFD